MGIELSITKNGEFVTELGRAYHFQNIDTNNSELDIDYDVLENRVEKVENYLIDQINNLVSYMEGRENLLLSMLSDDIIEDVDRIHFHGERLDEIIATIKDNSDELIDIGKKHLLGYILEDETMGTVIE